MTASKVSAAITAATHNTQVLPTTALKPVSFSSSVVAATHQTQVFSATDLELITFPLWREIQRRDLEAYRSKHSGGTSIRDTTYPHSLN